MISAILPDSILSSALCSIQNLCGRCIQASARAGSLKIIVRHLCMLMRCEIRSIVSDGKAPPSFFHLKNVDRAGDPSRIICCSVVNFHSSARRRNADNAIRSRCRSGVCLRATSTMSSSLTLVSRFILDHLLWSIYASPYLHRLMIAGPIGLAGQESDDA